MVMLKLYIIFRLLHFYGPGEPLPKWMFGFQNYCLYLFSGELLTSSVSFLVTTSVLLTGKCANRLLMSSGLPLIAKQMKVDPKTSSCLVHLIL